uniref:Uncharacterized protein n=1 Tax=Arundo donax TaxID=35708 RepID=A0A0A8XP11_ARUDO
MPAQGGEVPPPLRDGESLASPEVVGVALNRLRRTAGSLGSAYAAHSMPMVATSPAWHLGSSRKSVRTASRM